MRSILLDWVVAALCITVFLVSGSVSAQVSFTRHDFTVGTRPQFVAVGDFNGDGKADLAVANAGSDNVSILLGNGDGTFQTAVTYAVGSGPTSVAVGNFYDFSIQDLVVANFNSNTISVLGGNGEGTFQTAASYNVGIGPWAVAVGEFNGDRNPDLAVANLGGGVSVLLGNNDGTFQDAVSYPVGLSPRSVAVGDFRNNGIQDLAVANDSPGSVGSVSVLLGNNDGTFQDAVSYDVGDGPRSVAVGDFDGDGFLDLAVANYRENSVTVLLNNRDGTFPQQVTFSVGDGDLPWSIAAGEFDDDPKLDLAVANRGSNSVSVLINDTP